MRVSSFHKYNKQRELDVLLLPVSIIIYVPKREWYTLLKEADAIFVEIRLRRVISSILLYHDWRVRKIKELIKEYHPAKSYINNIKPRCELALPVSWRGAASYLNGQTRTSKRPGWHPFLSSTTRTRYFSWRAVIKIARAANETPRRRHKYLLTICETMSSDNSWHLVTFHLTDPSETCVDSRERLP